MGISIVFPSLWQPMQHGLGCLRGGGKMKALTLRQNRAPSTGNLIRGSIFKLSTQKMEKAQLMSAWEKSGLNDHP